MKYDIKAKPTEYNGRLFRSRLEARWACFFDFLGWDWEYEPFDLNGWSPDFSIKCKYPERDSFRYKKCKKEYPEHLGFGDHTCECGYSCIDNVIIGDYKLCYDNKDNKIVKEICLVEVKPIDDFNEEIANKIDRANKHQYEVLLLGNQPFIYQYSLKLGWLYENDLKWNFKWDEALFTNTIGFAHNTGSLGCRIKGTSGGSDGDLMGYRSGDKIKSLWTQAANEVMFLKPR